jgi:serine/threonine protein phosphatase 1
VNDLSAASGANLPTTAKGDYLYAIGDIHGRHDLLLAMLDLIRDHAESHCRDRPWHIIALGDLIDRGPDSAAVIETLRRLSRRRKATILLGNHEDVMLRVIDGEPGLLGSWLRFGGGATLRSFGVAPPESEADYLRVAQEMRDKIPESVVDWLRRRPISIRSGDYFFCHAGLRPGLDLNRQRRSDLLWIRDEFLASDEAHGVVVVHGHSISPDVELRHNRIGIDTGAYRTGMLTAAFLAGKQCQILSTGQPPVAGIAALAGAADAGLAGPR